MAQEHHPPSKAEEIPTPRYNHQGNAAVMFYGQYKPDKMYIDHHAYLELHHLQHAVHETVEHSTSEASLAPPTGNAWRHSFVSIACRQQAGGHHAPGSLCPLARLASWKCYTRCAFENEAQRYLVRVQ